MILAEYKVTLSEDERLETPSGRCIRESWTKEGLIHRTGAAAVTVRDRESGAIYLEEFYEDGALHRYDGPAQIRHDPIQGVREEVYYQRGNRHRLDGPATFQTQTRTGIVLHESWYRHGKIHRIDGPASIIRDPETGIATWTAWYLDDKDHRIDGPAVVRRDPTTGVAFEERWHQHGAYYRKDGPATVHRDRHSGAITNELRFFIEGISVDTSEEFNQSSQPKPFF